jgi:hypothetical protein
MVEQKLKPILTKFLSLANGECLFLIGFVLGTAKVVPQTRSLSTPRARIDPITVRLWH